MSILIFLVVAAIIAIAMAAVEQPPGVLRRTHGRRLDPTGTFAEVEVIHPDGRKEWLPDSQVDDMLRRAAAPKRVFQSSVEDRLSALERRFKAADAMVEGSVMELQEGSFDGLAKADDLDALMKRVEEAEAKVKDLDALLEEDGEVYKAFNSILARVEALEALATAPESETTPEASETPEPESKDKKKH